MKKIFVKLIFFIFLGISSPLFSITEEQLVPYNTLDELVSAAHKHVRESFGEIFDHNHTRQSLVECAIMDGKITGRMIFAFDPDNSQDHFKDWIRDNLVKIPESDEIDLALEELVESEARLNDQLCIAEKNYADYKEKYRLSQHDPLKAKKYKKRMVKYRREVIRLKRELNLI